MLSYSRLKTIFEKSKPLVRYKNPPNHWSVLRKKVHPIDKALDHFDDFYEQVFNKKWLSIRKGLLGDQKYVAVINNYGDTEETITNLENGGGINVRTLFKIEKENIKKKIVKNVRSSALKKIVETDKKADIAIKSNDEIQSSNLEFSAKQFSLRTNLNNAEYDTTRIVDTRDVLASEILQEFVPATKIKGREDFIPESAHYKLYDNTSQFGVNIEREFEWNFPEHLNVYCYEYNNCSNFASPKKCSTGVLNYYLMNGGSILPVLALDIKPGHRVLDMCAAPGGKSLLAIQTLYPECVVSNDISKSRVNRIYDVYGQFLYDFEERWLKTERIKLTNIDGRFIAEDNFDRILVDVPCTTDRHSLNENDNNIFKPSRIKERLQLPELQRELLFQALKLVKKGGIVVYSTCSLSPIQNDGVVHMALKQVWEETNMEIIVMDLSPVLLQTRSVFELANKKLFRYGHLIVPCPTQNYGPTYFCKLKKI